VGGGYLIVEGGDDVIDIPELIVWLHHHLLVRSLHQMVPSEQMKVYMKYLIVFYWMFNLQSVVHGKKTPSLLLNRTEQCFAAHIVHTCQQY
jgi:hypothetical protein